MVLVQENYEVDQTIRRLYTTQLIELNMPINKAIDKIFFLYVKYYF